MAALHSRCGHYILQLLFLLFLAYSQRSEIGCLSYFHTWCGLSANLECRSEMCYTQLDANTGCKQSPKICHLRTVAQLCWAISSQLWQVSTIDKTLVKQQYLLHMSSQYGELHSTNGWDRFISLGHHSKFQQLSRLGVVSLLHRHCSTEVNQTLHDVWPSPGLVHYIYIAGALAPITEFWQVQNSLCALILRSPTGWPKKFGTIILYTLTLPNINGFSKIFHYQNQDKICNNTIIKDPITPQVCRYTTLWNVKCLKSNNWKQDDFCNNAL